VAIDGNEATLEVPEGCIYRLKVVPFYEENIPQPQKAQLCCSLLELLWECALNANASPMSDR
jgi:hypothetical protein